MKTDSIVSIVIPNQNGGEEISFETEVCKDEDECGEVEITYTTSILMNSYGNSASIFIGGGISPQKLREIANEIEAFEKAL